MLLLWGIFRGLDMFQSVLQDLCHLYMGSMFFLPSPLTTREIALNWTENHLIHFTDLFSFVKKVTPHHLLTLRLCFAWNSGMSVYWDKEKPFWTWKVEVLFQLKLFLKQEVYLVCLNKRASRKDYSFLL